MKLPNSILVPETAADASNRGSLDVMARLILTRVDGASTIAEIGESCGLDAELSQKIMGSLASTGQIVIPGFEPEPVPKPDQESGPKSDPAPKPASNSDAPPVKIDLERDVNKLYEVANSINLYELLDLEPDVSRNELRSKYFTLSKRFHPDRAYGKVPDDVAEKMGVVFRRLTEAYDILSNPTSRAEYDMGITDYIELRLMEKKLKSAVRENQPEAAKPANRISSKSPARHTSSPPARPSAGVTSGRARISNSNPSSPISRPPPNVGSRRPSKPAPQGSDERRRQWKKERAGKAMASIFKRPSAPPPPPNIAKMRLDEAEMAIEQERFSDALRFIQECLDHEPENEKAMELLAKAEAGNAWTLAQGCLRKGRMQMRDNDLDAAQRQFEKALKIDAGNLDARHLLGEVLLKNNQDLGRALTLVKEAIVMGGQRARYFATLGELMLLAKDRENAANAFEKACDLEPDNKDYKKRLKASRK
ncbi:MAG: DnaJ domain-containing protein [Deltaproteobacteria bacterium]|nr:DnaJ domain-containing protein [Deltaproteobacteria bacterium]